MYYIHDLQQPDTKTGLREFLRAEYAGLGPVVWREAVVAAYFILLVIAWFLQEPVFITGWGASFPGTGEAVPAVLVLLLLLLTPRHLDWWPLRSHQPWVAPRLPPPLLSWSAVSAAFPWGLLLLRGAGFALARAAITSGLSDWIGEQLGGLSTLPHWAVLLIVCLATSLLTEVCSNAATANILLPVLADLALQLELNPLYLLLPAAVTCCSAFMLPVSCPPNAIVYQASGMETRHMVMAGIGINILTLGLNNLAANTYGKYLLNLGEFPDWANSSVSVQH